MNESDDLTEAAKLAEYAPIHPCWHMRVLVSSMADGTLAGVIRRYTVWHLSQCSQCTEALAGLERLRESLHALPMQASGVLSDEHRAHVDAAWKQAGKESV